MLIISLKVFEVLTCNNLFMCYSGEGSSFRSCDIFQKVCGWNNFMTDRGKQKRLMGLKMDK